MTNHIKRRRPGNRRPGARPPSPSGQTRLLAAEALTQILDNGDKLEQALAPVDAAPLDARDRGFARVIIYASLRHLGMIDQSLNRFLDRPVAKAPPLARAILRQGAAQILFLETPAFAAVSASTDAAKLAPGGHRLTGLINATLRRIGEHRDALLQDRHSCHNWPDWLVAAWIKHYGEGLTTEICDALEAPAPLDLTPRDGGDDLSDVSDARRLPTGTWRIDGTAGRTEALPGFEEGRWWVQDAAAALPVMALGDVAGLHVVDLCAAPGGKALQLAARGAKVTAVDLSEARLQRVVENARRVGVTVETVVADGREYAPDTPADAVLLDAPCTATGTLRRHPDVAWHRRAGDVRSMQTLQRALIDNAADMLRPGGELIYAVCSLQPEEGEAMISHVRDHVPRLEHLPLLPDELPGLPGEAFRQGYVRTHPALWPRDGGMDGFFIARFRRRT